MSRIAYISSTFPDYKRCGTGIYAGYITKALAQQGHEVHVITSAIPEIKASYGQVQVHKIIENWSPLEIAKLVQCFRQIRPEIIHINHPTAIAAGKSKVLVNLLPEMNRHLWKLPLVTTLHEFGHVSLLGKLKILPMILQSDGLTVTNQRYAKTIKNFLPKLRRSNVRVIDIGPQFNTSLARGDRHQEREKWKIDDDDKVLGFMGFMTPPKGFHNLIAALGPLLRKNPKIKILALSSWNQTSPRYKKEILKAIDKFDIKSQVIFSGFLEEEAMWQGLSAMDLCVYPFDYPIEDRSSGPLRQSLIHGLPTVTFAEDPNYSEFGLKHDENIWLVKFKDLDAFRNEVTRLLDDKHLLEKLASGASQLQNQFSIDKVSNELSRLYSELLT